MAKEHLIKSYGTLRYTIGTGCSGGSLAQQWIANAYPGIYQGILPTCSFPDAWSTATQFLDYHLLLAYFNERHEVGPRRGVDPDSDGRRPRGPRRRHERRGLRRGSVPRRRPDRRVRRHDRRQPLQPDDQPGRRPLRRSRTRRSTCSAREPKALWSANEKKLGHGFVRPPIDNVGVQYGLGALRRARSPRPTSSTSTPRSAGSTSTPTRSRPATTAAARRRWPGRTAAG